MVLVLYGPMLLRHSRGVRLLVAMLIACVGIAGVSAVGLVQAPRTAATPPSEPVALTTTAFTTRLRVGESPASPIEVTFSTAMEASSVEAALEISPPTTVRLSWNADRTVLTVVPRRAWRTATLHTITVAPGALASNGRPLTSPARAVFQTRAATTATISATQIVGGLVRLDSGFLVEFDRAMNPARMRDAIVVQPAVEGTITSLDRRGAARRFLFTPTAPLAAGTAYRVSLAAGLRDAEGASVADVAALQLRTAVAPSVVRFRPRDKTGDVDRGAVLSVRFTQPMDRGSTAKAWSVTAAGKPVAGTVRWAEGDTVLVFDPKVALGYGQDVVMRVGTAARSADGVPLAGEAVGTFTTMPRAESGPRGTPQTTDTKPTTSAGGGTWAAVEAYYLGLMNCTRTGGLVTSSGACSSPGGRAVAPLKLDAGISTKVSRPYAKILATRNLCDHFIGGSPGDRLRRAGYSSYKWAENLGCRSGDPFKAVLGSHLYFQGERSWSPVGGHYRNLMNATYDRAGIGVYVYGGRVRLAVDFYHP
ncbi:MAG TPA: Ig-like domain-containing protein [Candidatus Limnocylindrales bacterium]